MPGPTRSIYGDQLIRDRKPTVYVWYDRNEEVLYVGKSKNGITRPFGKHHVIDVKRKVDPGDRLDLYECGSEEEAVLLEASLILKLKPTFNTHRNGLLGKSLHDIECPQCGAEFMQQRSWQKFCSQPCRDNWHRQLRVRSREQGYPGSNLPVA